MYFSKFPLTLYSLDDRRTIQLVTNIATRAVISDSIKDNLTAYEYYDIQDGDTPEVLAYKLYGDSSLHWVILHTNDILDARFGWPLTTDNLTKYIDDKYIDSGAIHHYEDSSGNYLNANISISSNAAFLANVFYADVIVTNSTVPGEGYITFKVDNSNITIATTAGGFRVGDKINAGNAQANAIITAITYNDAPLPILVTNSTYEIEENETKRRIKILKSAYVAAIDQDFASKFEGING